MCVTVPRISQPLNDPVTDSISFNFISLQAADSVVNVLRRVGLDKQ